MTPASSRVRVSTIVRVSLMLSAVSEMKRISGFQNMLNLMSGSSTADSSTIAGDACSLKILLLNSIRLLEVRMAGP